MTRRITRGSTRKAQGSAWLKARRSSSILGPLTFDTVNHRHFAEIDFSVVHYTCVLSESSGVWWRNFDLVSRTALAAGDWRHEDWQTLEVSAVLNQSFNGKPQALLTDFACACGSPLNEND